VATGVSTAQADFSPFGRASTQPNKLEGSSFRRARRLRDQKDFIGSPSPGIDATLQQSLFFLDLSLPLDGDAAADALRSRRVLLVVIDGPLRLALSPSELSNDI
jgi:hypothetical protein